MTQGTIGPMKEKEEQITVHTYNWGPCLIRLTAKEEFLQFYAPFSRK